MSRILIVDDEGNMRKILRSNLAQDGHVVAEAAESRRRERGSQLTSLTR